MSTSDSPWQDQQFLSTVHAWVGDQLARLDLVPDGAAEQVHVQPWSTVLRVPTGSGDVWFKANEESLRYEAGLVGALAARRPDCVPPLLAVDVERGWMLMADAGRRLREIVAEERALERWLDVLPLYAGLQLDVADATEDLLALGVPDLRLSVLPAAYERFVAGIDADRRFLDAVPRVAALCDELAAFGIPETIQHDDLHDAQVFVRDGRYRFMDWGDACVTHPFLSLSVALEGVVAWGLDDVEGSVDLKPYREAYLAPFAERFEGDLDAAMDAALRLGWACRAVNGHVPGDDGPTLTRLRMFLDGRA